MFSTTLRAFDNGKFINADGFETDKDGNLVASGATATYSLTPPTSSAPFGSMTYDPVGKRLWIQKINPSGNVWDQVV